MNVGHVSRSDETETFRQGVDHPPGEYIQGMFASVTSIDEFGKVLCVPAETIALVVPLEIDCTSNGCTFKAIAGNHARCPAHQRSWYPLKKKNQRGGRWLGPEFLRSSSHGNRDCSCDQEPCKNAGYFPGQGALEIKESWRVMMAKTPHLFSSEKRKAYKKNPKKRMYLNPWHFFPEHRERWENNNWRLKKSKKGKIYKDGDGVEYLYPPPRALVQHYLDNEHFIHSYVRPQDKWAQQNIESKMPTWMVEMLVADGSATIPSRQKMSNRQLRMEIDMWRSRAMHQLGERNERNHELCELRSQLAGMKRKYEDLSKESEEELRKQKDRAEKAEAMVAELENKVAALRETLEMARKEIGRGLLYRDLYERGVLSKHVEAFTFFLTVEENDAFLDLINYADGSEGAHDNGDGMCENLRSYAEVNFDERKGTKEPPSLMDPDSDEYKAFLRRSKAGRQSSGRTWKDDYLAFCLYVRAGLTEAAAGTLCGVGSSRMSLIIYEWAQVLDDSLRELFPCPTRSQILHAYPTRFLEADGHARCYMLLDAFEIFAQSSSNPNVSSSEHSDYKNHTTVKFLGATDPIGCPWWNLVPDGSPGKASDPIMTKDTNILKQVPFGHTAKVDKGFIVDGQGRREGVLIDRPQKRRKKQVQQSSADTSQTQKIGNTRIIVENVNGELKLAVRYLNNHIPCLQFGIISKIVRIGYLMQNFKRAIIQNNDPGSAPGGGRPCRAEIRWYGATDAGLRDVRDNVRLWGTKREIKRHAELKDMEEHQGKSNTEISEIVLSENFHLKRRQEMYEELRGEQYDGEPCLYKAIEVVQLSDGSQRDTWPSV